MWVSDLDGLLPKPGYNKSPGLRDLACALDPRLRGDDTASLRQEGSTLSTIGFGQQPVNLRLKKWIQGETITQGSIW
jgi:hypothetical protein